MRVWEFDDKRAFPSDLVREQDFILRLRRLQRVGTSHFIINLAINALEAVATSRRALEAMQEKLKDFARITNGIYAEMSNGDVFMIWEETADAAILTSRILSAILPPDAAPGLAERLLIAYHMPQDYVPLRERANYYIEVVRTVSATQDSPSDVLKSSAAHGPLTAWSVDQIGKLLAEIDLQSYSRTQAIYRRSDDGTLTPVSAEHFVSFDDLKRERFPKLEIITPEHLFMALCEMLDQKFLAVLTETYDAWAGRDLWFNLSVATVMGSVFAQFARRVPMAQHGRIGFEIHRGDLLQDFSLTLNAVEVLRREGFRVALDAITPDMLGYVDFAAFDADLYKINMSKDRTLLLNDQKRQQHLAALPRDKVVFMRCDSPKAYELGVEHGIRLFQGWTIDDMVKDKKS